MRPRRMQIDTAINILAVIIPRRTPVRDIIIHTPIQPAQVASRNSKHQIQQMLWHHRQKRQGFGWMPGFLMKMRCGNLI